MPDNKPRKRDSAAPPAEKLLIELPLEVLERVDAWRAQEADKPAREDAIQRLLVRHFWPNL
jgi:hypothetical protein